MIKRKYLWLGLLVGCIVCLIAAYYFTKSPKVVEVDLKTDPKIGGLVRLGSVLCVDSNVSIVNGTRKSISENNRVKPFIQGGITYVPIKELCDWFNAKINQDPKTKIVTLNSKGFTAQFITDYNIIIFNKDAIIMKNKPLIKDNEVYLPAGVLAKILNISFYQDFDEGLLIFGAAKKPNTAEFQLIKEGMSLKIRGTQKCEELDKVNVQIKVQDLYSISREGRLYVTDENGTIAKWTLLDDYKLLKEKVDVSYNFDKNSIFIVNYKNKNNMLYKVGIDGIKEYSLVPEQIIKNDLTYASKRYLESRIIKDIFKDYLKQNDSEVYKTAMSGELQNTDFMAERNRTYLYQYGDKSHKLLNIKKRLNCTGDLKIPLTTKYDLFTFEKVCEFQKANGLDVVGYINEETYDRIQTINEIFIKDIDTKVFLQKRWLDICNMSRSGDILLFRNNSAQDKYGFNTHAALILNVSKDKGEIHVLHARSEEHGVGADKTMDRINFDSLYSDNYWIDENQVMLYTVPAVSGDMARKVSDLAYLKYKDYTFGYGGFQGQKETTCVDLIRDAYKDQGIELLKETGYSLSIKKALDKDIRWLLLIPDDLMLSDKLKLQGMWERE